MPQQRRRSGFIIGVLALGLLAGAALTASPAHAASGPGPFYAEPAWDQKIAPDTRFLVLTNWNSEAVLDIETGLVWERSPATTTHTWNVARQECASRTTGNRKSWRLPSVHELASLVHPAQQNPTLPPGNPFLTVQPAFYWSATTNVEIPSFAWVVNFDFVRVNDASKTSTFHAWCVRGGMNVVAAY